MNADLAHASDLIAEVFPRLEGCFLAADTMLIDLQIDSQDKWRLVLAIEEDLGCDIDDATAEGIFTIGNLAQVIAARTALPRGPVDNPALYRDAEADGAALLPGHAA
ncbi:acyl carrier protein [Pararhodobacter aggregans]|uniref:Acyl carrier protein n=1 Tax=Pararhodobacter aggregans TaxID=404875 RepID=A0A2T7URK5_9RHOB|nr:acyl carrier protein [Pararhodobacter aggregans]PTX02040.1 acyl carrier protein [Pararhodobacter aggregans]PVE47218.1 hypothetical protein DDE23_13325 [Pararhodobacter aggregans]